MFSPGRSDFPSRKSFMFIVEKSDFDDLDLPLNLPQQDVRVEGYKKIKERVIENKVLILFIYNFNISMFSCIHYSDI